MGEFQLQIFVWTELLPSLCVPMFQSKQRQVLSPLSAKTGDRMNKQEEFILERVDSFGQMEC